MFRLDFMRTNECSLDRVAGRLLFGTKEVTVHK